MLFNLPRTALLPFLLPLLTPTAAAPATSPDSQLEPRLNTLRIPLIANHKRQHHPDLDVRQAWLKSEGRNMRRKYERHLNDEGKELVRKDLQDQRDEIRRRGMKRQTGRVQ
jgi:hypothetical protein